MGGSIYQIAFFALGGCFVGGLIAWSIQAAISRRRIGQLTNEALLQLDDVTGQRDQIANEYSRAQSKIEHLEASYAKRKSAFKSLLRKSKILAANVVTLRTERENTKDKLSTIQNALVSLREKSAALQTEFDKTREFYKRELMKSLEQRKALQKDITKARAEQKAFLERVESSSLEHGSAEDMIAAAQLRLGQLEVLERNVNKLEGENAELRNDAIQIKQQLEARERDLRELDELKLHNRQLVQCVEALEGSRQSHEADAERYREQADQSEKESDTLRLKLEDLEKNFADIEKEQHSALRETREAAVIPILRKQS